MLILELKEDVIEKLPYLTSSWKIFFTKGIEKEKFLYMKHGIGFTTNLIELLKELRKGKISMIWYNFIPRVLAYLVEFYQKDFPLRGCHLYHLKDELKWLKATLSKEGLRPSDQMKQFLKSIQGLVVILRQRPGDYFEFEQQMDMNYYSAKAKVYKDLEETARLLDKGIF